MPHRFRSSCKVGVNRLLCSIGSSSIQVMRPSGGGSPLKMANKSSTSTKTRNPGVVGKASTTNMVSPRQKIASPRGTGAMLHTEQRHMQQINNYASSVIPATSSLSHSALKHGFAISGNASNALATMNQTISFENQSAERPKKLSTTMSVDPDLVREIYRVSEQERWPKEKLFKVLADPTPFKKSLRY